MSEQILADPEKHFENAKREAERLIKIMDDRNIIKKASDHFKEMNSKQKQYLVFPFLEKHGIISWTDLDTQQRLIDEKKCELPSTVRSAISHLHMHCLIECAKEIQNLAHE